MGLAIVEYKASTFPKYSAIVFAHVQFD